MALKPQHPPLFIPVIRKRPQHQGKECEFQNPGHKRIVQARTMACT